MSESHTNSFICDEISQEPCDHSDYLKNIKNSPYVFCFKCSSIVITLNEKYYTVFKVAFDDDETSATEIDPIDLIKYMIKRQNRQYKILSKKFTTKNSDYVNQRKKLLIYLQKLSCKLKYSDNTFYLSLFLIDNYFSHVNTEEMSEKELFLIVLGFFLISSKYIENDIFEPEFEMFCNFNKSFYLTINEIRTIEMLCLFSINYDMFIYSSVDWLNMFLNIGIIFDKEINNSRLLGNIYIYTQKLLTSITSKMFFFKFTPIQIALSIIQISRERYLINTKKLSYKLFEAYLKIFNLNYKDIEDCYNTIKKELNISSEKQKLKESDSEEGYININTTTNINTINYVNSSNSNSKISLNENVKTNRINLSQIKFRMGGDLQKGIKKNNTNINLNEKSFGEFNGSTNNLDTSRRIIFNNISTVINYNYNTNGSSTNLNNISRDTLNNSNVKLKFPIHFIINCNNNNNRKCNDKNKVKLYFNNNNQGSGMNIMSENTALNSANSTTTNKKQMKINKLSFLNMNSDTIKLKNSLYNPQKKKYTSVGVKKGIKLSEQVREKVKSNLLLYPLFDKNNMQRKKSANKNNTTKFTNGKKLFINFKENLIKSGYFTKFNNNNGKNNHNYNKQKSANELKNQLDRKSGSRNNVRSNYGNKNKSLGKDEYKLRVGYKKEKSVGNLDSTNKINLRGMVNIKRKFPKLKLNPFITHNK